MLKMNITYTINTNIDIGYQVTTIHDIVEIYLEKNCEGNDQKFERRIFEFSSLLIPNTSDIKIEFHQKHPLDTCHDNEEVFNEIIKLINKKFPYANARIGLNN